MGERYHHARVCEPALVEELTARAGEAVATRDAAPLEGFVDAHRARQRLVDGYRVPLDRASIATARGNLTRLARRPPPEVRALVEATAATALPEGPVAKTAQDALIARLSRLERLVEIDAPGTIVSAEVEYARAALDALAPGDLGARLAAAGLDGSWEGNLVERALALCAIPGRDGEVGLTEHFVGWDGFVGGAHLVPMPQANDDPSDELLGRCLERFGEYTVDHGHELHREDWQRFASSFGYYLPPVWGAGDALRDAALEVARAAAELDGASEDDDEGGEPLPPETRRALDLYRAELLRAASAGHAVVEWVVKL